MINSIVHNIHLKGIYRIVFVNQKTKSKYYGKWIAGDVITLKYNVEDILRSSWNRIYIFNAYNYTTNTVIELSRQNINVFYKIFLVTQLDSSELVKMTPGGRKYD